MDDQDIVRADGLRFGPLGEHWMHLCVDMQRMFGEATPWQTPWLPRVLPNVVRLAEAEPSRTIFTRFVPPLEAHDMPGSWQRYYRRWPEMTRTLLDPGLIELMPELARYAPPAALIDKSVYSPWLQQSLDSLLRRKKTVDTLVISGAETEVCVVATVLGAIDRGYRVVVATDAICSSADPTHDAMLEIYHSRFGMQVETASVTEILESVA